MNENELKMGKIVWYTRKEGRGVLRTEGGREVVFYGDYTWPQQGENVLYIIEPRNGRVVLFKNRDQFNQRRLH